MKTIATPKALAFVLVLAAAGWLQAAPPANAPAARPNCYVLSAGIDNYPGAHLDGCINDAHNTVAAFRSQKGTMFTNVYVETVLDGDAKKDKILQEWNKFAKLGKRGDTMVLFLSGHGGNNNGNWSFAAIDGGVADRDILAPADAMASQGKKVVIVIDACFCGQLRINAKAILDKHRDPKGGGIVLMLSSAANQTSAALGKFSAFAKAFVDSVEGKGDLNRDGKITLTELKSYSFTRTHELTQGQSKQDAEVAWSPSISGQATFAVPPASRLLTGRENLGGYGNISFRIFSGGRAEMMDRDGTSEGTWGQTNGTMTLRFGGVTYSGRMNGNQFSGTAQNDRTRWSFAVNQVASR